MVCLSFSLGKAETSMSCHRMLGKRAWLTLRPCPGPRSGKFGDGSGKRKLENKDAYFATPKPVIPTRPGTGFRSWEADSPNELFFLFAALIVTLPWAGSDAEGPHPGVGRREGHGSARGAASHGLRAPSRGERGPGVPPRGTRSLAPHTGTHQETTPGAGIYFSSLRTVSRGVPLLSPPALRRESDNEDKTPEAGFSSGWINLPFSF